MIRKLNIHNFKIHRDTFLDLGNLTIFTGTNCSGKSSIFQLLLMLRESLLKRTTSDILNLSGDSFNVGSSTAQLVNWDIPAESEPNILKLELEDDINGTYGFSYGYELNNSDVLKGIEGSKIYTIDELKDKISLFDNRFKYLSAYKLGPRASYDESTETDKNSKFSSKLGQGEYTVSYLSKHSKDKLKIPALSHSSAINDTLQEQVEAWIDEISNGVSISIDQNGSNYELFYSYAPKGKGIRRRSSSINAGYGLSIALSIVVAILAAEEGSLIIIENPEAHIHPAGQSALMRLISLAANNGVQILVESHSDHIINGALVAAKKELIDIEKLSFYYFIQNPETLSAEPFKLSIGEDCRIKKSPKGFFDQMNVDLEVLFDLKQ